MCSWCLSAACRPCVSLSAPRFQPLLPLPGVLLLTIATHSRRTSVPAACLPPWTTTAQRRWAVSGYPYTACCSPHGHAFSPPQVLRLDPIQQADRDSLRGWNVRVVHCHMVLTFCIGPAVGPGPGAPPHPPAGKACRWVWLMQCMIALRACTLWLRCLLEPHSCVVVSFVHSCVWCPSSICRRLGPWPRALTCATGRTGSCGAYSCARRLCDASRAGAGAGWVPACVAGDLVCTHAVLLQPLPRPLPPRPRPRYAAWHACLNLGLFTLWRHYAQFLLVPALPPCSCSPHAARGATPRGTGHQRCERGRE